MNKTELVAAMSDKAGISKKVAEEALAAFTEAVTEELKNGGKSIHIYIRFLPLCQGFLPILKDFQASSLHNFLLNRQSYPLSGKFRGSCRRLPERQR